MMHLFVKHVLSLLSILLSEKILNMETCFIYPLFDVALIKLLSVFSILYTLICNYLNDNVVYEITKNDSFKLPAITNI